MTQRDTSAILRKIKALRAKTTAAGATAEEAATAAAFVARLMAEHQLGETDIRAADYGRDRLKMRGTHVDADGNHPFTICIPGIEHISGSAIYIGTGMLIVIGDEVGREIAAYLCDMVRAVMEAAWRAERKVRDAKARDVLAKINRHTSRAYALKSAVVQNALRNAGTSTDRKTRRAYLTGMAAIITRRLLAMAPARRVPDDVLKTHLRDFAMVEGKAAKFDAKSDAHALHAGAAAGKSASLSMGVATDAAAHQITE